MASVTRFYALILSIVLLLSGVPGFYPTIGPFKTIVAFFALTTVHAVVHVAVGFLGLLITALASDESVRIYTLGIAILYGVLAAAGFAQINFGPVLAFNAADNWLHGSIFVLSIGVFLLALADARLHQRKARIAESLPATYKAVTSAPAQRVSGVESWPAASSTGNGTAAQRDATPWYNQSLREQAPQAPQPLYQPPSGQLSDQSSGQQRDPWSREQRRGSGQAPASAPNPWSPFPPEQSPWPQSQPQPSQPSPSQWPRDSQPARIPRLQQPRQGEQWPLEEWPSLNDPDSHSQR
jgi:hypothetical protein